MAARILLAAFFLLLFPATVHAAFTIESISPSQITDLNQELTIFASASNLKSSPQYLQFSLTKEGKSSYFGFTQNNVGEWGKYESSPQNLNSLLRMDLENGSWNGELKGKIDAESSGYQGPGNYLVKIWKHTASSKEGSNTFPITLNIPVNDQLTPQTQTPTPLSTPQSTQTPTPKTTKPQPNIQFSTPSNLKVGEEFEITISTTNFESGSYFVKARIGVDSSHLSLGQTLNSEWLKDTDSWSKFPQIGGSGKVKARLSQTASPGSYKIKLSLKKGDDSPIVSEEKSLSFAPGSLPSPTVSKTQSKTPTTPKPPISEGVVLATTSSVSTIEAMINDHYKSKDLLATLSAKTVKGKPKQSLSLLLPEKVDEGFQLGGVSAVGGFILLCTGAGIFLRKKLSQDE